MAKEKKRAKYSKDIGAQKYELIKAGISRYNIAFEHRFYLEATALIESLISDRLESRLAEINQADVSLNTIGNLLNNLNKVETDPTLKRLMNISLNS